MEGHDGHPDDDDGIVDHDDDLMDARGVVRDHPRAVGDLLVGQAQLDEVAFQLFLGVHWSLA